jgi:hypothetical protein
LVCSACNDPDLTVTGESVVELYPYEAGSVLLGDETGELDCEMTTQLRKGTGGAAEFYIITVACPQISAADILIPPNVDGDAPDVTVHAGGFDRDTASERWRRRCVEASPGSTFPRTDNTTVFERVDDRDGEGPRVFEGVTRYWDVYDCFKGRVDFRLEVR